MTTSTTKKYRAAAILVLIVAGLATIYGLNSQQRKTETVSAATPGEAVGQTVGLSKALAKGPMAGVVIHPQRKTLPAFMFKDASGNDVDLTAWKGRVVLVNLWATWCTPCRKEMPDIAKLEKALGGKDFDVIALSVDRKGLEASQAFLREIGADNLKAYTDQPSASLAALQALGLPATFLIDRHGFEAARILGPADWSSPEAQAMIKALTAEK